MFYGKLVLTPHCNAHDCEKGVEIHHRMCEEQCENQIMMNDHTCVFLSSFE